MSNGKKNDNDAFNVVAWILTIVTLSAFWPLGLVMLFLNLSGRLEKIWKAIKSSASSSSSGATYNNVNSDTTTRSSTGFKSAPPYTNYGNTYQHSTSNAQDVKYTPVNNQAANHSNAQGRASASSSEKSGRKKIPTSTGFHIFLLIFGIIFTFIGGILVLGNIEYILYSFAWGDILQGIALCTCGVSALVARFLGKRKLRRFAKYSNIVGDDEIVSIKNIAKSSGMDMKKVRKEIENMIEKGYFGDGAYLDYDIDSLVLSPEAGAKVREFAKAASAKAQEAMREAKENAAQDDATANDRYMSILRELRELNDNIADESISAKIDRIEDIAGKIFRIVDEQPDKLPQIRKFMDYYLPTTLKLLRSYSILERQGIDGDNISSAKADIDRILDTLITGYEQQLDLLFQSDAIDISSDIEVLETMLRNDGLSDDESGFSTMGGV